MIISPSVGTVFQLIVLSEDYIIFDESEGIDALNCILRGDNYDTQGMF